MVIYIAGPYGRRRGLSLEDRLDNVGVSLAYARSIIKRGHVPLVPVLYHYVHEGWYESPDENYWLEMFLKLIERCDAVFRIPLESEGADREVEYALEREMKVFYSMEEVPLLRL